LYCAPTGACVADRDACTDAACVGDERYCPAKTGCFQPSSGETCSLADLCDDEALPFACEALGVCVADESACAAACINPAVPYCATLERCSANCPEPCPAENPYRCGVNNECVPDEGTCAALCPFDRPWCPALDQCVNAFECR
jgi:hypothetical protein